MPCNKQLGGNNTIWPQERSKQLNMVDSPQVTRLSEVQKSKHKMEMKLQMKNRYYNWLEQKVIMGVKHIAQPHRDLSCLLLAFIINVADIPAQ